MNLKALVEWTGDSMDGGFVELSYCSGRCFKEKRRAVIIV